MFPTLKIRDLNVKLPIIQGGMGVGVSMSKLAAAVANEGGIGVISGAHPGFKEDNFRTDNAASNVQGLIKELKKSTRTSSKRNYWSKLPCSFKELHRTCYDSC